MMKKNKSIDGFLKRAGALFLALCLGLMLNINVVHATDKSAADGLNYVAGLVGQQVGSGQCVALIKAYYSYLGVSPVSGNACDYATNALPAGWARVQGGVPQPGDILVYTGAKYGHVVIYAGGTTVYQQNWSYEKVERTDNWNYNKSWYSQKEGGTKSYWGYIRPNFNGSNPNPDPGPGENPSDNVVKGVLDLIETEGSKIRIAGWAYDSNSPGTAIEIHLYYGNGGVPFTTTIRRPDVGVDGDHGFDYTYDTGLTGTYNVKVYACSCTGASNLELYNGNITYTTIPKGSNVRVTGQSKTGYTVSCNFTGTVDKIRFATWTEPNGQDDIKWPEGAISGNTATCSISIADHGNQQNTKYLTHIYGYIGDKAYFLGDVTVNIETTPPTISDISVKADKDGYTVTCKVADSGSGIDRVVFPTWTVAGGQDDLAENWGSGNAVRGTISNGIATFRVNRSAHNNEFGLYSTHIYAFDKCGNQRFEAAPAVLLETDPPTLSNVKVETDKDGYLVTCDVSDSGSGIDRIVFPTWTLADGQDDLAKNWSTADTVKGTIENGKASFYIKRSDHNNEYGTYRTHIYLYDKCSNQAKFEVPDIQYDHTVSFDANGGEGAPESVKKYLGEELVLPTQVPVRKGYSFVGYSTSQTGTASDAVYQPGGVFNEDADTTLYAVWELVTPDAVLPEDLIVIEEEAFAGSSFTYVKIPIGITEIGDRAFAECRSLKFVYIPPAAELISKTAFENVPSGLTIIGEKDSYAEFYAVKNGYNFIVSE